MSGVRMWVVLVTCLAVWCGTAHGASPAAGAGAGQGDQEFRVDGGDGSSLAQAVVVHGAPGEATRLLSVGA